MIVMVSEGLHGEIALFQGHLDLKIVMPEIHNLAGDPKVDFLSFCSGPSASMGYSERVTAQPLVTTQLTIA